MDGSPHQSPVVAGVDVGGTFTDVVVHADGERPRAVKVPTTPEDQAVAVEEGSGIAVRGRPFRLLAHGTTTATNAVLERAVARTVLVTTVGFSDVLQIGRQQRPALYDLAVTRPAPVVERGMVVTVQERIGADGEVVVPLDDDETARVVDAVADLEPESIAISLLFAYVDGRHERTLAAALERLGVPITCSHVLLPEFREYERTSTVALNAAVAPVMQRYLSNLGRRVTDPTVTVMTSGGGTAGTDFVAAFPVHTLLSGPAAGVVAAGAVARSAGFDDAVAFDMGGTSTDVCLVRGGRPHIATSASIDGLPFTTPAVDIHTVGAGGGSIGWIDRGGALRVGPRSAGARPGPACYGHGGTEPTVTDAHVALAHLGSGRPLGSGRSDDEEALVIDPSLAHRAVGTLPDTAGGAGGILAVVRATMVRALRKVTTERGVDPSGLALVAYGGAGPLHATALARQLGCRAVVIPPAPGVLSALGLLLAAPRHEASRTVMAAADARGLTSTWEELEDAARARLRAQGVEKSVEAAWVADVRYARQSHELRLDVEPRADVEATFHRAHEAAYGYAMPGEPVVVVTQRVVATGPPTLDAPPRDWDQGPGSAAEPRTSRRIGIAGPDGGVDEVEATVVARADLGAGDGITGPAVVEQVDTTTLLGPEDTARTDDHGNLVVHLDGD